MFKTTGVLGFVIQIRTRKEFIKSDEFNLF